jgi:hypothetical protein
MKNGPSISVGEALAALVRYAAEAPPDQLPRLFLLVSRLQSMLLLRLSTEIGGGALDDEPDEPTAAFQRTAEPRPVN